ncbi:MAG: imidazoleglycerol-phosphate dehydratase [Candidatus Omnitrophica bacterium]|nr:imidazoleglycerol-phosphate dehydratase [Candidatus Omnitrophota bacterium]
MKRRICTIKRRSKETDIILRLNLDGKGKAEINTGIGLLNHMLELFSFHGFFDLYLYAKGDIKKVDLHHTNEDVGIVLGTAFKKALGDKKGINRFGFFAVPMEENLAQVIVDISGRGYFKLKLEGISDYTLNQDGYSFKEMEHFFEAFSRYLGMNLFIMINTSSESDLHSILEPVFKALGVALQQAISINPRRKGLPSTKGIID